MSSISAIATQSAALYSPISRNATSSGAITSAPQPEISSMSADDVSFGFGQVHVSAAVDTSGLAQYNGGASDDIAATSEYVQQKVIYEAAMSIMTQSNMSSATANHLLRDGY